MMQLEVNKKQEAKILLKLTKINQIVKHQVPHKLTHTYLWEENTTIRGLAWEYGTFSGPSSVHTNRDLCEEIYQTVGS